ncbi:MULTISPECIES: hypothetical protein [unclassified Caballeronia]|uniref:SGNH/GDSL hydrolase family protein n=1 Tax=unclassified Caballeronia TaxID=2646786 RepID=UPI002028FF00|nr:MULTISPECIES: hypothetical protein [unclassified Caballeronia]
MNRIQARLAALAATSLLAACGGGGDSSSGVQSTSTATAPTPASEPAPAATPAGSSPNIVAIGDSLTQGVGSDIGGYPAILSGILNNRTFANLGIGGQTSTQIAARVGALPSTVTVDGDAVPASNTAVHLSSVSIDMLSTPADDVARSKPGTLCSVHGALQRTADGGPPSTTETYTFVRDSAGSAVPCAAGSAFLGDSEGYDTWTAIIWVGRNNGYDAQTVLADVKSIVQWLKPAGAHFAVLSIIKGDFTGEYAGGEVAKYLDDLNASLKAAYPDNFIDVETALVNAYNPSLPQDVIDHSHDIPPSSLRSDAIHLNDAGYTIVAGQVKALLASKNW